MSDGPTPQDLEDEQAWRRRHKAKHIAVIGVTEVLDTKILEFQLAFDLPNEDGTFRRVRVDLTVDDAVTLARGIYDMLEGAEQ